MPSLPPVTIATLPFSPRSMSLELLSVMLCVKWDACEIRTLTLRAVTFMIRIGYLESVTCAD